MVVIDSVKFFDEFTGSGGGINGMDKPNYNIGDKATCKIAFHIKWGFSNKVLAFDAAAGTITNINSLDYTSFITDGELAVGDTVALTGTASNNVTITITAIADKIITTSTGLVNETANNAAGAGTNKVDGVQFFYNLLETGSQSDFTSLTDKNTKQRFVNKTALDASVGTAVNFLIDTDSFAWNTNALANAATGETSEVTISGAGISANVQSFLITHTFIVTPIFLASTYDDLKNNVVPDFIQADYCFEIDTYVGGNLRTVRLVNMPSHLGANGFICWFNQVNSGNRPDYYLYSTGFTDVASSAPVSAPDIAKETLVNAVIKSRGANFVNGDKVVVNILWGSLVETDYQDTETTWKQNFFYDRKLVTSGFASAVNGEAWGTDYQNLKDITATVASTTEMDVQFTISLATGISTVLKSRDSLNRLFLIWFTTQKQSITQPKQNTRVAMQYMDNALYDKNNTNLMGLLDTGIESYQYPNEVTDPHDIEGIPGDPFYNRIKFWVESAVVAGVQPLMQNISIQVAAIKSTKSDFILEEKLFDFSNSEVVNGAQVIEYTGDRGFTTYDGDPRNRVNIVRVPARDSGTKLAYEIQYGLVLRYEYWLSALTLNTSTQPDIAKEIKDINHLWSNYNGTAGWSLAFRVTFNVKGYNGGVTNFVAMQPMVVNTAINKAKQGVIPGSQLVQLFFDDGAGGFTEVDTILQDAVTRVRATYTGDFSTLPDSNTLFVGIFFADIPNIGSIFTRRFASTEIASEADSPFSAPDALAGATSSYANGNCRINFFGTNMIVVETYFDPTIYVNAGQIDNGIFIYNRLQFYKDGKLLLLSDGTPALLSTLEGITLN